MTIPGAVLAVLWVAGPAGQEKPDVTPETEVPVVQITFTEDDGVRQVEGYALPTLPDALGPVLIHQNRLWSCLWEDVEEHEIVGRVPLKELPVPGILAALESGDRKVRDTAFDWMVERGPAAAASLAPSLRSPRPETRILALRLAQRYPHRALRKQTRACLTDTDPMVRRVAMTAYAEIDPSGLVHHCEDVLYGSEADMVRHQAVVMLGEHGTVAHVDLLLETLGRTTDRSVRLVTFVALGKLTGQRLGRDEAGWRAWWANHREEVLEGAAL